MFYFTNLIGVTPVSFINKVINIPIVPASITCGRYLQVKARDNFLQTEPRNNFLQTGKTC